MQTTTDTSMIDLRTLGATAPAKDDGEISFLFGDPILQTLMDRFQEFSGLATAIIDLKGLILVAAGWQEICTRFHRVYADTRRHCIESDVYLSANLNQGQYSLYRCKNGLWDMATPVVVDGRHVANVFSGQFLLEGEPFDPKEFEAQAERYGFDRPAYMAALEKVPRVTQARAREVMEFYVALAQLLVQIGHGSKALRDALQAKARAEEAGQAALVRARLASIVESSSDAIIAKSLDGIITSWNRGAERIYGYAASEILGRHVSTLVPPDRRDEAQRLIDTVRRGDLVSRFETVRLRKDGSSIEVSLAVSPIRDAQGALIGISTIARDVTDQKRAERELRAASLYARSLIEASLDPMVTISPDGKITDVNEASELVTGLSREALIGTDFADFFTEPARARSGYRQVLAEGQVRDYPLTVRHLGGRTTDVLFNASVYRNEAGALQGVFAAARDVTERRLAELALQRERDRVHAIMEASPVAMIRIAQDGRFDFANAAAQTLLGLEKGAAEGRAYEAPAWKITDWEGGPFSDDELPFNWVLRTGRPVVANLAINWPDGRRASLSVRGAPLFDPSGAVEGAVFGLEDASERRRMEEQLRQSQKLEAVGRLAGGVAHDFNNLLTAIMSGSEELLAHLREPDPLREDAVEIHAAAIRAADLTRQLLIFSRKQVVQPRVVDLGEIVLGLERMLGRLIGEDIELQVRRSTGAFVRVDPGHVEQVIVNLAVNARDAMPRGGRLTIETAAVDLDGEAVGRYVAFPPGAYVLLTVSDTGCGMTPEVQSHLFEPFFTTKEAGKGTGLGLSTVYGIVSQAGGRVMAYSELGKGSVFKVYLPRVDERPSASIARDATPLARGTETLLFVEDEPLVRRLAVRALRAAGYTVFEASDGVEALAIAGAEKNFDALLTDTVMPRMGGKELAHELRLARPGIRVLFMSGYTEQSTALAQELDERSAFLQKPFSTALLLRSLRELVDRRIGGGSPGSLTP